MRTLAVLWLTLTLLVCGSAVAGTASANSLEICQGLCSGEGTDADGDGLTRCIEDCLGTDDLLVDSDFDGMADGFEAGYGLDPLNDDRAADTDEDALTALEEFQLNSNPTDAGSPSPCVFVDRFAEGPLFTGAREFPFRTIQEAMDAIVLSPETPFRVIVHGGSYYGLVQLPPRTTLQGAPGQLVRLYGAIEGAEDCAIRDLHISATDKGKFVALVTLDNVSARLTRVSFLNSPFATGLYIRNTTDARIEIDRCAFEDLDIGIDIDGHLPVLRRSSFYRSGTTGVRWMLGEKQAVSSGGLGDETDPSTGWNTWIGTDSIDVLNTTDVTLLVENNDWSTADPAVISEIILGPSDFEPFLAPGSGILAAALSVTVVDAATQARVGNASVALNPSGFPPMTANNNGTYSFAAVQSGTYQVNVQAPGFDPVNLSVTLADAESASLIVPLGAPGPDPECGCGGEKRGGTADLLVAFASIIVLLAMRRGAGSLGRGV
jgi:hypothetical protein